MNLSKFQKMAQDQKATTLRHLDGHQIKIMHSALPAELRAQLEGIPMFKEGGNIQDAPADSENAQKPVDVNVNVGQPTQPQVSPVAQVATMPIQPNVPSVSKQDPNLIAPDQALDVPGAAEAAKQGLKAQEAVDIEHGAQAARIEEGYNKGQAQIAQQKQNDINAARRHADELKNWMDSNPGNARHYQDSMEAPQKVMTALGLLAGGVSSGVTGGPNPAMDFLNKQIDRDINMQKENADRQKSVFSAYMKLYDNEAVATDMARVGMIDAYAHQYKNLTAKLATPQARANFLKNYSEMMMAREKSLLEAAGRVGTLSVGAPVTRSEQEQKPVETAAAPEPVQPAAPEKSWYQKAPGELVHDVMNPSNARLYEKGAARAGESEIRPEKKKEPSHYERHILAPDAAQKLQRLKYGAPKDQADYEKTLHQYTQADQAEKAAARLDEVFNQLAAASEGGGIAGRLGRSTDLLEGTLGGLGSVVPAIAHSLTGTQSNRDFKEHQDSLVKYIANALRGTNVSDTTIHEFVRSHSPEYGDSPKDIERKREEIRQFILDAPESSLLKQHGLSKRKP